MSIDYRMLQCYIEAMLQIGQRKISYIDPTANKKVTLKVLRGRVRIEIENA